MEPLSPLLSGILFYERCDELWSSHRWRLLGSNHHIFQHGVYNSVLIHFGNLQDLEFLHVRLDNSKGLRTRYLVPRFRNLRTTTYHIAR